MTEFFRPLPETPAVDTDAIRRPVEEAIARLRDAATEWGITPDSPEAPFVSTMIAAMQASVGAQAAFVDELDRITRNNRAIMSNDAVRSATNMQLTQELIGQLRTLMENSVSSLKDERANVTKEMADVILPRVLKAVDNGLVIRQKRVNVQIFARTVFGVASLMVGLVIFGSVWGSWNSWGGASRLEDLRTAIDKCEYSSGLRDSKGDLFCPLSLFVRQGEASVSKGGSGNQR